MSLDTLLPALFFLVDEAMRWALGYLLFLG